MNKTKRENIDHLCRVIVGLMPSKTSQYFESLLGDLACSLQALRDRTAKGDMMALDEFFARYVFDDNIAKDMPYKREGQRL